MTTTKSYDRLRKREQTLIAQINETNRTRAALAAQTGPSEASRGRQKRLTNKLVKLRDQLAKVHEEMRRA